MPTQSAVSRNPRVSSSGKVRNFSTGKRDFPLAAQVAKRLGIVPAWDTVQIIRLAIETEALVSETTLQQAAELIVLGGKEESFCHRFASPWEEREVERLNSLDIFWFKDSRWRKKFAYWDLRERLKKQSEQTAC